MKIEQTRITLDRVKISGFLSEETIAFHARVLLDGNAFAEARNAGHGGCTDILPIHAMKRGAPNLLANNIHRRNMAAAIAYCATLKAEPWTLNGQTIERTTNLDDVVDELVADAELDKRVRASYARSMKKYLCYAHNGVIYQYRRDAIKDTAALCERIHAERPGAAIFDMLPSDSAYSLYKRLSVKE